MWKIADRARSEAIAVLSAEECERLLDMLARLHEHLQSLDAKAAEARRPHAPALEPAARGR
jgi:hypothetical protein